MFKFIRKPCEYLVASVIVLIGIVLPPLGVLFIKGFGKQFLISVPLTLLGYLPGLIHTLYLVATENVKPAHELKESVFQPEIWMTDSLESKAEANKLKPESLNKYVNNSDQSGSIV